jgi:hypothetical protein
MEASASGQAGEGHSGSLIHGGEHAKRPGSGAKGWGAKSSRPALIEGLQTAMLHPMGLGSPPEFDWSSHFPSRFHPLPG